MLETENTGIIGRDHPILLNYEAHSSKPGMEGLYLVWF